MTEEWIKMEYYSVIKKKKKRNNAVCRNTILKEARKRLVLYVESNI